MPTTHPVPCSPDPLHAKSEHDLLIDMACSLRRMKAAAISGSFNIPAPFTSQEFTYVGGGAADDDRISTIVYKDADGATVATLTFTYYGSTNNIQKIELS